MTAPLACGVLWGCAAAMLLGCSEGLSPAEVMAGHYSLRRVDFHKPPIQSVPAISEVQGDTTVVEGGDLTLSGEDSASLQLVYRWRYGGVPGGASISDTLTYVFLKRAAFGWYGQVDWFLILRQGVHIAYLIRLNGGTLILIDYDRAGTMDFHFEG